MTYKIVETKGMAQCFGSHCVKLKGKIVGYFRSLADAEAFTKGEGA